MASMRILLRPTLMLACLLAFTVADAGVLRSDGGAFVDAGNGTVVLRGFNLSQHHKFPPFRPNTDPALFTRLTAAGINVVRHQFNWEAFEPEPGVHDESYLDHYAGVTERAAAAGLYVIVDIHQDAFSRWTLDGCGEGFPRWAIPAGFAQDEPDNGLKCYAWPLRVMWHRARYEQLFNDFYTPGNPARERYLLMLERIAQRLAGQPNVVGYEPLNEPLGDSRLLMAFYADAVEVVRRHDPAAIAFLTPEIFTGLGTEATTLPIPPFGNVAFAPHYYDPPVYAYLWFGRRYEPVAANNRAVAQRWNAALLLGEFGAPPSPLTRRYLRMIYDDLDAHGDSATQWAYTPEWTPARLDGWNYEDLSVVDDQGQWRGNYTPRPYAARTAGAYGHLVVDTEARRAAYTWQHDPGRGATEIRLPPGMTPKIDATGADCRWQAERRLVSCTASAAGDAQVAIRW